MEFSPVFTEIKNFCHWNAGVLKLFLYVFEFEFTRIFFLFLSAQQEVEQKW